MNSACSNDLAPLGAFFFPRRAARRGVCGFSRPERRISNPSQEVFEDFLRSLRPPSPNLHSSQARQADSEMVALAIVRTSVGNSPQLERLGGVGRGIPDAALPS